MGVREAKQKAGAARREPSRNAVKKIRELSRMGRALNGGELLFSCVDACVRAERMCVLNVRKCVCWRAEYMEDGVGLDVRHSRPGKAVYLRDRE